MPRSGPGPVPSHSCLRFGPRQPCCHIPRHLDPRPREESVLSVPPLPLRERVGVRGNYEFRTPQSALRYLSPNRSILKSLPDAGGLYSFASPSFGAEAGLLLCPRLAFSSASHVRSLVDCTPFTFKTKSSGLLAVRSASS